MVEAFAPLREDPSAGERLAGDPWSAPSWRDAAFDYHKARNGVSVVSYTPDELERLRRLMDDDVSIERAWRELNERAPGDVPIATLRTAEFFAQQNDSKRFKTWLARHSREQRQAILKHLNKKRGPSCQ